MEREITFRGKGEFTGKWIYGYYVKIGKMDYICTGEVAENNHLNDYGLTCCSPVRHAVDPATVGQYTGLTDRNGKKIFEGDILKWDEEWPDYCEVAMWDYELLDMRKNDWAQYCEVIGNYWDKPELLEVKK